MITSVGIGKEQLEKLESIRQHLGERSYTETINRLVEEKHKELHL